MRNYVAKIKNPKKIVNFKIIYYYNVHGVGTISVPLLICLNGMEKKMNKFQTILAVVALGSSVLVGCNANLEKKVDAIAADVDALKAQQSKLANDVAFVKSDAARANERLDNLARRYKK